MSTTALQDDVLLDAYSRAVVGAVERVGPSVVRIDVGRQARGDGPRRSPDIAGTGSGLILAPDEFLKTQGFAVAAGTTLTVTGMPGARVDSQPAMLVRELKAGNKTYTLRDKTGKAAWQE